jgi:hypothetical protein
MAKSMEKRYSWLCVPLLYYTKLAFCRIAYSFREVLKTDFSTSLLCRQISRGLRKWPLLALPPTPRDDLCNKA